MEKQAIDIYYVANMSFILPSMSKSYNCKVVAPLFHPFLVDWVFSNLEQSIFRSNKKDAWMYLWRQIFMSDSKF